MPDVAVLEFAGSAKDTAHVCHAKPDTAGTRPQGGMRWQSGQSTRDKYGFGGHDAVSACSVAQAVRPFLRRSPAVSLRQGIRDNEVLCFPSFVRKHESAARAERPSRDGSPYAAPARAGCRHSVWREWRLVPCRH
jgi:hypothetical protein